MNTSLIIAYAIVFLLSALPLLEAFFVVPVGILGGMNFLMTSIVGITGNLVTLLILIVMMGRVKTWYLNRKVRKGKERSKRTERAENIFKKYGTPGLGLIGPFILGSHFAALTIVILGGPQKATFWWVALSVVISTVGISILVHLGVDFVGVEDQQFLRDILEQ